MESGDNVAHTGKEAPNGGLELFHLTRMILSSGQGELSRGLDLLGPCLVGLNYQALTERHKCRSDNTGMDLSKRAVRTG